MDHKGYFPKPSSQLLCHLHNLFHVFTITCETYLLHGKHGIWCIIMEHRSDKCLLYSAFINYLDSPSSLTPNRLRYRANGIVWCAHLSQNLIQPLKRAM
ncbi:hypothetical protein NQ315_011681 [Exocentrus adspersus]|uniref:Uncharacterized protein n=1 Tax=Exocentrus adspersus TaxID=1586481 RepID=A0AAV8W1S5_9CUCU|nr:hypothetical protein NQ315_011681 [Exocentrus adspersus]